MIFVFFAAISSVLMSVFLKISQTRGLNTFQVITWNYLSASALVILWYQPDFRVAQNSDMPWWIVLALGFLLPTIFIFMSNSLRGSGIIKTELAQRLSIVWTLLASISIYNEKISALKWIGIVFGIFAVLCILASKTSAKEKPNESSTWSFLNLFGVWIGYALIDILLKHKTSLDIPFASTLSLSFVCSLILSLLFLIFTQRTLGSAKTLLTGLALGFVNFSNIALYLHAHSELRDSPATVFAGMNLLVVVFGVLAGVVVFKEKINFITTFGLIMGIISFLVITIGY